MYSLGVRPCAEIEIAGGLFMDKLYDLLQKIRVRPGLYIGRPSLTLLHGFIIGYIYRDCLDNANSGNCLDGFREFVAARYEMNTDHGWADFIQFFNINDEQEAFNEFYRLLDEFIKIKYITIKTAQGEQQCTVNISEEWADSQAERITVSIEYDGRTISGRGGEYPWTDTFTDLQKNLPEGAIIKSCMTCAHASVYSFGDAPWMKGIFCTKNLTDAQKNAPIFFAENENERQTLAREFSDKCDSYQSDCVI